ncbi:FusB/FusC family EF-G-binding protein [Halalkalibacter hemicellulosilyticus]|uniref:Fibronectin-binding protein n=1 Tax=Halalkalibacter hemicellulosilyticusJCM 9152 TaxID=1236971 RepID=W4QDD8_9BACI|nr:elongation factor G-binding protein [Halalkalibacter hemicellulosilyticus]GAE29703.1 fibronectin-binding protein [Halalkalibacter hemicellulosilyticusJCM 9152]
MINSVEENVPFLKNDQYNYIKFQLKNLVYAYSITKDKEVLNALKYSTRDKVFSQISNMNEEQKAVLNKMMHIEEDKQVERFLLELKNDVVPFKAINEKTITKLFPKVKKLKMPSLKEIDFRNLSYLGWYDIRSERKFLIIDNDGTLIGIQGSFKKSAKGICALCHGNEDVGLFMAKVKSGKETYTNRGNYICADSFKCNENLTTLDQLNHFVKILNK